MIRVDICPVGEKPFVSVEYKTSATTDVDDVGGRIINHLYPLVVEGKTLSYHMTDIGDIAARIIALLKTDDVGDIIHRRVYLIETDCTHELFDWVYTIEVGSSRSHPGELRVTAKYFGESQVLFEKRDDEILICRYWTYGGEEIPA